MQHYTCDLCGKCLGERRFVAKLELYPSFDPDELTEADLDIDHLQEVASQIDHMDTLDFIEEEETRAIEVRFDLCPSCHSRYRNDPLGKQLRNPLHFSEN
jgi:hypothetical protein